MDPHHGAAEHVSSPTWACVAAQIVSETRGREYVKTRCARRITVQRWRGRQAVLRLTDCLEKTMTRRKDHERQKPRGHKDGWRSKVSTTRSG